MNRLTIEAEEIEPGQWVIADSPNGSGLEQIADFAIKLGSESSERVVYFEIFWPWETEFDQTWDAVRVDLDLLSQWDGELPVPDPEGKAPAWWIETLPPYAELTPEQRQQLGITGYDEGGTNA